MCFNIRQVFSLIYRISYATASPALFRCPGFRRLLGAPDGLRYLAGALSSPAPPRPSQAILASPVGLLAAVGSARGLQIASGRPLVPVPSIHRARGVGLRSGRAGLRRERIGRLVRRCWSLGSPATYYRPAARI